MPQVKCPKCGTVRLVVEGKKKNCRKCGTPLTADAKNTVKPEEQKIEAPAVLTAADLQKQYPEQTGQIIKVVQLKAEAEALKRKPGDVTAEILLNTYPKAAVEMTEIITAEVTEKITAEVTARTLEKVAGLKVEAFAEQFPKLFNQIAEAVKRQLKKADRS